MQLNENFQYRGWSIKYAILEPESRSNEQTRPVVFVHGTPWSSVTFVPLAKALLARGTNKILLYDLPGYGQSQILQDQASGQPESSVVFSGDTSVRFQAEALAELLQHLGLTGKDGGTAPSVIAHDIAGTIALRAHLLHGCEFRDLLLMDTNTVLPWGDGFYRLVRAELEVFLKLPYGIYQSVVKAVIESAFINPKSVHNWWKEELAQPWLSTSDRPRATVQRNFIRQIAQANDADVAEMLDSNLYTQVRCPVKILWGEDDKWIPKDKMEQLAGMLKHCLKEFITIPHAGHLIMVDQPERVAVEVLSWLLEQ